MQLFLTSSVNFVAKHIASHLDTCDKKLAFIYTAAEVEEGGKEADWCQADRRSLVDVGFEVIDYSVSDKNKDELKLDLAKFDALFVSGGNTFFLLQQSQKSGFAEVVRDLVINQGKIYIGSSAGSVIAGPDITPTNVVDNAALAPDLNGNEGFGLVNFCIFPHWGSTFFRDLYLNKRLDFAYREDQVPIVVLTDRQYVWITDNNIDIVSI